MTKGLGYFGCDYENPLIKDIAETWGDDCSGATESDTAFCLYNLSWQYYMNLGVAAGVQFLPSSEAIEVKSRINELSQNEIGCLIQALAHKDRTRPLGFWGLSYGNELIKDISETWNELQDISEIDRFWLISELSEKYAKLAHRPGAILSDEAVEIVDRMNELDSTQIYALIRTLAN
jgi:hypothetical protein